MTDIKVFEGVSAATFSNVPAADNNAYMCNMFTKIGEAGVDMDMISVEACANDTISVGFTFDDNDLTKLLPVINGSKGPLSPMISCGNVKFVIKSVEMINKPGFAAKILAALKSIKCTPLLITTGLDEISLLVSDSDNAEVAKQLEILFR